MQAADLHDGSNVEQAEGSGGPIMSADQNELRDVGKNDDLVDDGHGEPITNMDKSTLSKSHRFIVFVGKSAFIPTAHSQFGSHGETFIN